MACEDINYQLSLRHLSELKEGILYGDPAPASGFDAVYCWEDAAGEVMAVLAAGSDYTELRISNWGYRSRSLSINDLVAHRLRYGGTRDLGEFPFHSLR